MLQCFLSYIDMNQPWIYVYCKVISLQLIKINGKKFKTIKNKRYRRHYWYPCAQSLSRVQLLRRYGLQPARLLCPWDSPSKNTGVGCHFLLQCMKVKSENEVTQLCLTLCDPMNCSLPGPSIHGISQARVPEQVAIAFSGIYMTHGLKGFFKLYSHREKVKVLVTQLCPALCVPMDCSLPGTSVNGILQAKILECVAIPLSRGSSGSKDQTGVSCIEDGFFTI